MVPITFYYRVSHKFWNTIKKLDLLKAFSKETTVLYTSLQGGTNINDGETYESEPCDYLIPILSYF